MEQGYKQSYKILTDNGYAFSYETFLSEWDHVFSEFDKSSAVSFNEFSMTEVCRCYLAQSLGKIPTAKSVGLFRDTYLSEWNRGVSYICGLNEMLGRLSRDYVLVLVSNTNHAKLVKDHLHSSGMHNYLEYVITSVEYGKRKPSHLIFEYALKASNGSKDNALFVGDSYSLDYEGALSAGIRCLLIDPEHRYKVPARDRLNHILALPSAILKLM